MDIPIESAGNITFAEVPVKELDASNAGDFKAAMMPIVDQVSKLVLDLGRMQFIDSSGLGAILSCLRQASARGGDLKLCRMTRQVRTAFELVRMHRVFEIFESREDAAHAFHL